MRKNKEELNLICKKYNINTLWSFSRYDTYKTDTWEYFLKYILHKEEDKSNSIYCVAGNVAHSILEDLYSGKIAYEEMLKRYEDELFVMHCADLKYNRNDSEKNEMIANKYENCIKHFFKYHNIISFPHKVEEFILIKVSNQIYFQGYADFIYIEKINNKKYIHIVDYKTSTKYSGNAIESHGKQLMLYAEGIRQALNIPLDNIICEWNFLKYVTVTYEQKNGKKKDRYIERNVIGESLINTVKMWLKHFGYDEEDIEKYVDDIILNNSINNLPKEVQEKFVIQDCYIQVPLSEQKIDELKRDIIDTVAEIEEKENEYKETKDEMLFWQDVTDADAFRLATLSSYSRKLHKPYDAYLKEQEMFQNNTDDENDDIESSNDEDDLLSFLDSL